jgi:trehalose 6-phosphate synthase
VNERWATRDWEPIVVDTRDNYARSLAGLVRSDVLLVNPIKDGLNLVALEGPLANTRDGVLCLSREAGAHDVMGGACVSVQPFDLVQTAAALHEALEMNTDERAARAAELRRRAAASPPAVWLETQLRQARS